MHGNVLPQDRLELQLLERPRQKAFRAAVAKTIRDIKSKHSLSNVDLAEEIGCCADTISNGENQNNDMTAIILLSLAWKFGEEAILPVRALYLRNCGEEDLTADDHREAIEHHAKALARMVQ